MIDINELLKYYAFLIILTFEAFFTLFINLSIIWYFGHINIILMLFILLFIFPLTLLQMDIIVKKSSEILS